MHRLILLLTLSSLLLGCSSAYYHTMEKFGVYKNDLLISRVEEARHAQTDAKEEFKSALEQFSQLIQYNGGELEIAFKKLNKAYERSENAAEKVAQRIRAIESVAQDLFNEWQQELNQYSNPNLRADSAQKLQQTKQQYQRLIQSMKNAQATIPPVLTVLHDQVLYLKHNLNARAIAALQGEYYRVENNIRHLINELDAAITESEQFIKRMHHESR